MRLYGYDWGRQELEAYLGRVEQVGGLRRFILSDGAEAGVEQIQVRTGAGLTYYVTLTRGMDISLAEYCGAPLSWQSPNGDIHPAYFEPQGKGWLRTAAGGLLMTCGLTQVGSPCEVDGESLGLHGRYHHLPARQVAVLAGWQGDNYEMHLGGVVEETSIFGHKLRLRREISSRLGANRISLHDEVENFGFSPAPHMLLYHFNFGFPLMSKDTTLQLPSRRVIPREEDTPLEQIDRWQTPAFGYQERVYYHEDLASEDGWTEVRITNLAFPIGDYELKHRLTARLRWKVENLPLFVQWKMPGTIEYVLGIEPANCHVEGRLAERERETLVVLQPGERRGYDLEFDLIVEE